MSRICKKSGPEGNSISEVVENKLYFSCENSNSTENFWYYCLDNDVHYNGFYKDFGPYDLSVLYRFCAKINEQRKRDERKIVVCCSRSDKSIVNAAYLIGSYAIIYLGMLADAAYVRLSHAVPQGFIGFVDAAMAVPSYRLHLHDVLRGIEKAVSYKWLSFDSFDPEEYEFYEKVDNGDLNWIIPGKILSFCGPHNEAYSIDGYPYHSPELYFDYFRTHGISTIIRLNKRMYEAKKFLNAGFDHVDLFFVDGTTPSEAIVERFLEIVDSTEGGVAVHCKAGLGRTGTLIACWLMKEFGLTAAESMAWIRVCRPGSVIGQQQLFLVEKQPWCWSLKVRDKTSRLLDRSDCLISKADRLLVENGRFQTTDFKQWHDEQAIDNYAPVQRKFKDFEDDDCLSEECETQGDRLLARKAKAQRHVTFTVFTSPTTPVKPLSSNLYRQTSNDESKSSTNSVEHMHLTPISRVVISSTSPSTTTVRPCSTIKHTTERSKPYPSAGVKVHLPPCCYDLRSRSISHTIQASNRIQNLKELPPNTAALGASRKRQK